MLISARFRSTKQSSIARTSPSRASPSSPPACPSRPRSNTTSRRDTPSSGTSSLSTCPNPSPRRMLSRSRSTTRRRQHAPPSDGWSPSRLARANTPSCTPSARRFTLGAFCVSHLSLRRMKERSSGRRWPPSPVSIQPPRDSPDGPICPFPCFVKVSNLVLTSVTTYFSQLAKIHPRSRRRTRPQSSQSSPS